MVNIRIMVSGGTGLVGNILVQALISQGHKVTILSRRFATELTKIQGVTWIHGDLRHPIEASSLAGIDTLYHLASELSNPAQMEAVNVRGTANLLTAAKRAGVRRWIQLSSVGVYGPPTSLIVTEGTTPEPANEYERTKLASDRLVQEACYRSDMDYVILRPSNIIGTEIKNESFFGLVKAVSRGCYFFIGPRGAIATYVHVEDVVRALIACQEAVKGSIYNLSSDCTWEALIERIASLVGVRSPRIRIPAAPLRLVIGAVDGRVRVPLTSSRLASLTNRSRYSSDRIVHELGFSFAKPMPEGIEDVVGACFK